MTWRGAALIGVMLLAACAQTPVGPAVQAVPGPGRIVQESATPVPNLSLTQPVQDELIRLGYLPRPADGAMGPRTSNAISRFQGIAGMPVDGLPSAALLATLQATR
jgi:peptidoglycan hydrolase-like protein with peptidoglycan-binding domain